MRHGKADTSGCVCQVQTKALMCAAGRGMLSADSFHIPVRVTRHVGGAMRLIPLPELIIVALVALVILGPRTLWALRRHRVRRR